MAGELYENIGLVENAVQSYVEGGLYDKAKACV